MKNSSFGEILNVIKASQSVVLVSHRHPDGDTLGAALALAHYIESLEKKYTLYCVDTVSHDLEFLPKAKEVGPHEHVWSSDFDTLIVVDAGDLQYAGIADTVQTIKHPYTLINIDHHVTNQQYGKYNLVDSTASSTCEIVYNLLDHDRAITREIATCLLTGVVTDTGSFSNLATTASSVETASKLVARGANLSHISKQTLEYRPLPTLRLWGKALQRLHIDPKTDMVVTVLTQDDIKECGASDEAISGISNFLNSLAQAKERAVLVLTQNEPGVIKGSLRTTSPLIDVSEFAKLHGGGGHKKAAGFTLPGTLTVTDHGYSIIEGN